MFRVHFLDKLSFILILFGSINWGSIGILNINFLRTLSFHNEIIERMIYILIFISALNLISLIARVFNPKKIY